MTRTRSSRQLWSTALAAIVQGASAREASRLTGASLTAVNTWAKLAGMTFTQDRTGGIQQVNLESTPVTPKRCYRRLTHEQRLFIEVALAAETPWSMRRIATHLGVHVSTISREVQKTQIPVSGATKYLVRDGQPRYHAGIAHYEAMRVRRQTQPKKLDHPLLRALVIDGLVTHHSPGQIAGRLKQQFPTSPELWVSHETIYQALYVQGKGALRHELTVEKALRSGRTGRKPKSKLPARNVRPWLDGARLSARPATVEDRAVPGHWEGDLVVGPNNSGIVTLVERSTRAALIGKLPGARDSVTVIEVLQGLILGLPQQLRQTLTWDQGAEMAGHASFTIATDCRVFFCDPHSPWQRGSNENLNGLIREFFPKGTDFNTVTVAEIQRVQDLLNDRPRQTLGFYTPREKLEELITGVALAT